MLIITTFIPVSTSQPSSLPDCTTRPTVVLDVPRIISQYWCLERVVAVDDAGELAFTAIVVAPDDTLYATRPMQGEIWVLRDSTGDGLQDHPSLLLGDLRFPNALAWHEGALYIGGDGIIYRWQNESLDILVDDLPAGRGFLPAGLIIHDNHLYMGIPAPCDFCNPDDERHGSVMRFDLDGGNPTVVARGLRYPAGLAVHDDLLWVTDTARDDLGIRTFFDELNTVDLQRGDVPHFGWPYCIGADNQPDLASDFDCSQANAPTMLFQTHSTPLALYSYREASYRHLQEDLLVVLSGAPDHAVIRGYQLISIDFAADGHIQIDSVIPNSDQLRRGKLIPYAPPGYAGDVAPRLNRQEIGVWPHHLYGVAVNTDGWIYVSVGGGIINVLRPTNNDACNYLAC